MKNLTLITLCFLVVSACTQTAPKKQAVTFEQTQQDQQAPQVEQKFESFESFMSHCQTQENCKAKLDEHFDKWSQSNQEAEIESEPEIKQKHNTDLNKLNQFVLSNDFLKNDLVKGALNEWLTWKRPQLIHTWQYYQYLQKDIRPAIEKYNLEEAFVLAIMAQESGGRVHSNSRAGAGGLFQLMPATAKRLGLSGKKGAYDLRYSPKDSAQAAALYIHEQAQIYDNDLTKILAAYNSGENRFARLNKVHNNKSIWDKSFYYDLPRETRHYIPTVIAAYLIFKHPEKFNVQLETIEADTQTVQFAKKASLSELAVCLGQEQNDLGWFRVIRNLNSGIKADKFIPAGTQLQIPKSLAATFEANCKNKELMNLAHSLHDADFKDTQGLFKYRVRKGDSLSRIVRKFSCTTKKEIARLNNLKSPRYLIRAGKYLKIPQC